MLLISFGVLLFVLAQNLSAVGAFFLWVFRLMNPLIIGLCIAFVLNVMMRGLENRVFAFMGRSKRPWVQAMRRPVSLIATFLVILLAIAIILLVIIPGIDDTVKSLTARLPVFTRNCITWVSDFLADNNISSEVINELQVDWNNLLNTVADVLKNGTGSLFNFAANFTTSVFGGLVNFFLGLILAIYILLQKEKIGRLFHRAMRAFLPDRVTDKIEEIARLSGDIFSSFITGQLVEAVILGSLCFVGMLIFRFPYAGVVSVLVGVTALIPIFGAWIGGGISAFLILMESPIKAVLFIVFLLVLQQLENNLIYPRVVGKQVGLPAILVLLAVLIGSSTGGVLTILVSVPLCSVLYTLFRQAVDDRLARRKARAEEAAAAEEAAEPSAEAAVAGADAVAPAAGTAPAAQLRAKKSAAGRKRKKK